jgi:hypothetical protein
MEEEDFRYEDMWRAEEGDGEDAAGGAGEGGSAAAAHPTMARDHLVFIVDVRENMNAASTEEVDGVAQVKRRPKSLPFPLTPPHPPPLPRRGQSFLFCALKTLSGLVNNKCIQDPSAKLGVVFAGTVGAAGGLLAPPPPPTATATATTCPLAAAARG